MNKMDEQILTIPRQLLFGDDLLFQGVLKDAEKIKQLIINMTFDIGTMRRGDAEEDPFFKQPITYAVIRRGKEIFAYERLKGAGETKLHGKISLGVGGHMNEIPGKAFTDMLVENMQREIEEELNIDGGPYENKIIGLINDDSDKVGEVHIGILAIVDVPEDKEVSVRETDQLAGQFVSIESLKEKETYERLENWSKIVVDML